MRCVLFVYYSKNFLFKINVEGRMTPFYIVCIYFSFSDKGLSKCNQNLNVFVFTLNAVSNIMLSILIIKTRG